MRELEAVRSGWGNTSLLLLFLELRKLWNITEIFIDMKPMKLILLDFGWLIVLAKSTDTKFTEIKSLIN